MTKTENLLRSAEDSNRHLSEEIQQLREQLAATERKYLDMERRHRESERQLDAEREKLREERAKFHGDDYADMDAARNRILDLEQQLAAEREKVKTLVDALKNVRKDNDELWTDVTTEWRAKLHHNIRVNCDAALAKVKEK